MTYIPRTIEKALSSKLTNSDKILLLYGARQIGKTTLIRKILKQLPFRSLEINADQRKYIDILSSRDLEQMKLLVEGYDLLFMDEAQRIPDIGINLKILHDQLPQLKIVATGSSSFELANRVKEPLTGRTWTYKLFPISMTELKSVHNSFEIKDKLEEYMVFGMYPEVFSIPNQKDKIQYLQEITSAYLYKDILEITSIKHSHKIHNLLRLLALQTGSQVSLNELGNSLGMSKDTVASYIDLLEQSFVLFRLSGFSRNLRKEVVKMDKIYFYDLGIRNMLINNMNPPHLRNDTGALWENLLISERKKYLHYQNSYASAYFWRTYTGAELDYVEDKDAQLFGYEFKWGKCKPQVPLAWAKSYPEAGYQCINRDNFFNFINPK